MFTKDKELKELFDSKPVLIEAKLDGDFHAVTKIEGCTIDLLLLVSTIITALRKTGLSEKDLRFSVELGFRQYESGKSK